MKTVLPVAPQQTRVSTIELFFDLVFVFTITQLTRLVEEAHTAIDVFRAFLVLTLIWWIYAGYAWLTNSAGSGRMIRLVMIAAMAGFFVMALSVPRLFGADGLAFGLAYLYVVLIHAAAFVATGGASVRRGVLQVAPFNVAAALLAIAAGLVDAAWDWMFLLAAVLMLVTATIVRAERKFSVRPDHYAERHGLVVLVALGETIVAIGVGADHRPLDLETTGSVVLALVFIATFWWTYFDRDDERAERVLHNVAGEARSRLAVIGFWYAHLIMIAGIVLVATAVRAIVAHDTEAPRAAGWLLAAGTSLYLLGDVGFRWAVGIAPLAIRAAAAAIALGSAGIAVWSGSNAQLGALTMLMMATLTVEHWRLR